jgi:hypothetical protein
MFERLKLSKSAGRCISKEIRSLEWQDFRGDVGAESES